MTNRLYNDICRCHDDKCPDASRCERYIQRDTGRVHSMGLYPYAAPFVIPCPSLIRAGEADQ